MESRDEVSALVASCGPSAGVRETGARDGRREACEGVCGSTGFAGTVSFAGPSLLSPRRRRRSG